MASELSDPSDLTPSTDGNEVQKLLGSIADRAKEDKFLYTKFFAIGLFRLLELTGKQALQCMSIYLVPIHVICTPAAKPVVALMQSSCACCTVTSPIACKVMHLCLADIALCAELPTDLVMPLNAIVSSCAAVDWHSPSYLAVLLLTTTTMLSSTRLNLLDATGCQC